MAKPSTSIVATVTCTCLELFSKETLLTTLVAASDTASFTLSTAFVSARKYSATSVATSRRIEATASLIAG